VAQRGGSNLLLLIVFVVVVVVTVVVVGFAAFITIFVTSDQRGHARHSRRLE
jgi:hypothetical protein